MNLFTQKTILIITVYFIAFSIYLFTLHPTISPYRDSGDLIVSASTLGIAHPPGYPVYSIFGKIFTEIIPFGNIAYRINVSSALFGALALVLLMVVVSRVFNNSLYLSLTVFFLSFSTAFWRLSQVSEMYSLNALFAALIILLAYTLTQDNRSDKITYLYLLSFICGFSCGNHQTIMFIFPGLLWLIIKFKILNKENIIKSFGFFLLGLTIYLFLPFRSFAEPLMDWGNPEKLHNFFRVITRADYGGMRLHPEQSKFSWTPGLVFSHLGIYSKSLASHFTIFGVLLGFWGMIIKRKNKFFQFLLISLIISGPGFIILSNLPPKERTTLPILEPHLVLPGLIFVLFIVSALSKVINSFIGKTVAFTIILISFLMHYGLCNYRYSFYAYDYGRNLLKTIEKYGILYNPDDPTAFITTYMNVIENRRKDIKLVAYFRTRWGYELLRKNYPEILPKREILSGRELERIVLDYNRTNYPIYSELPGKFPQGYLSYPQGILYRLASVNEFKPSDKPFLFYTLRNQYFVKDANDFFTNQIISYYASSYNNLGLAFADNKEYGVAKESYFRALYIDTKLVAAYNNMGSLEYFKGNFNEAEKWFSKVIKLDPGNASAYFNLGIVYKAQKRYGKAKEVFEHSWNNYHYANAGNELGLIALDSGELEKSVNIFQSVININPNYILAFYNLGLAYSKLGDKEKSIKYFELYMNNISDPTEKQQIKNIIDNVRKNEI